MTKRRRAELSAEATRRNLEQLARLGGELRRGRLEHRLRQADVAGVADLSRSTVSAIERGHGGGHTLDSWQRLALAVERPLRVELERDRTGSISDSVHLELQELVLRRSKPAGWGATVELSFGQATGRHSIDVVLRHEGHHAIALVECWNTLDDVGAAIRSSDWKLRRAGDAAIALGRGEPYRVSACWVVRATKRNRALVRRYPEVFASKFPASSIGWLGALTSGSAPPSELGLVWTDGAISRLFAWRRQ